MLDKAIEHGKEHRKPYYHSGRFDLTCRPHGGCPWCEEARLKGYRRDNEAVSVQLEDVENMIDICNHSFLREAAR